MKSEGLNSITKKSSIQHREEQIVIKLICKGCCKYIEKKIFGIEGVEYVNCNYTTGLVTIGFIPSKTSLDKIELTLADIGYDTPGYKRKIEFYTDVPKCCKHRDGNFAEEEDNPRA